MKGIKMKNRIFLSVSIALLCAALLCAACALEGVMEPPSYTVAYLANGGSGQMENSVHVYGTEKKLNSNNFTYLGYVFSGWGLAAEGPVVYRDQQNVKNLTKTSGETISLYAQWEELVSITYYVVYNANGGTGTMENSVHSSGVPQNLRVNTFTRVGYTFTGWASTSDGPVMYADQQSVINLSAEAGAIVNLYAVWEEDSTGLPAPANVQAEAQSMSTITIHWDSVNGASSYNIYRSTGNTSNFTKLNSAALTSTSYNDNYLTSSTTYYYRVAAIDSEGVEGNRSTIVNATTDGLPPPVNVSARALSASSIIISWDSLSGASSYNIYRAETETGNYTIRNITAHTETSFTDTGLSASTTYYYKVCGVTGGTEGNLSTVVSATTAVIGIVVEGSNLAQKLAWLQTNAVSNSGYTIEVYADESISPTSLSYSGRSNITVALSGIGANRTINLSSNGSVFTIASSVTLILDNNITLRGRAGNTASLVTVNTSGSLEMRGNTEITGNTYTRANNYTYGGGVYVSTGGNFIMNGSSSVSGNTATASGSYTSTSRLIVVGGGGTGTVYYCGYGGGVFVDANGTFAMHEDAKVSSNSATNTSNHNGYGSGVCIGEGVTFTMRDNTVVSNNIRGQGVYIYQRATFTMWDNAAISGNTGGGVGVGSGATFIMQNNTVVSNNTVSSGDGGGVYNSGTFTMRDNAAVSNNTASSQGGGVYNYSGTFIMRDNAVLSGNTASGGGVYNRSNSSVIFRIAGGTIYGTDAEAELKNTGTNAALYKGSSATAQYGTFNGDTFISSGTLSSTNNTIRVVNGVLQ